MLWACDSAYVLLHQTPPTNSAFIDSRDRTHDIQTITPSDIDLMHWICQWSIKGETFQVSNMIA